MRLEIKERKTVEAMENGRSRKLRNSESLKPSSITDATSGHSLGRLAGDRRSRRVGEAEINLVDVCLPSHGF